MPSHDPLPLVPGAHFSILFPFVKEPVCLHDEDGPYNVLRWRPGCHTGADTAEDTGFQLLTVLAVCELPRCKLPGRKRLRHAQTQVVYVQQWQTPEGDVFGKTAARMCSLRTFRSLLAGYRSPYTLSGQPSWREQQQAEEDAVRAAWYTEEDARWAESERQWAALEGEVILST